MTKVGLFRRLEFVWLWNRMVFCGIFSPIGNVSKTILLTTTLLFNGFLEFWVRSISFLVLILSPKVSVPSKITESSDRACLDEVS